MIPALQGWKNTHNIGIRMKQKELVKTFNPLEPKFTIVIFIHYKPRIANAILDLQWIKMIWSG